MVLKSKKCQNYKKCQQCRKIAVSASIGGFLFLSTRRYDNIYSQDIFDDIRVKVGKKTCTCNFMFFLTGEEVDKRSSEVKCDKKCSGAAKNVELGGVGINLYVVSFSVKKLSLGDMGEVTQERRNIFCNILLLTIFISTYITSMLIRKCSHSSQYYNTSQPNSLQMRKTSLETHSVGNYTTTIYLLQASN